MFCVKSGRMVSLISSVGWELTCAEDTEIGARPDDSVVVVVRTKHPVRSVHEHCNSTEHPVSDSSQAFQLEDLQTGIGKFGLLRGVRSYQTPSFLFCLFFKIY